MIRFFKSTLMTGLLALAFLTSAESAEEYARRCLKDNSGNFYDLHIQWTREDNRFTGSGHMHPPNTDANAFCYYQPLLLHGKLLADGGLADFSILNNGIGPLCPGSTMHIKADYGIPYIFGWKKTDKVIFAQPTTSEFEWVEFVLVDCEANHP